MLKALEALVAFLTVVGVGCGISAATCAVAAGSYHAHGYAIAGWICFGAAVSILAICAAIIAATSK